MIPALNIALTNRKIVVKKTTAGSVAIIFSTKQPLYISDETDIDLLQKGYTVQDIKQSNLNSHLARNVLKLVM